MINIYINRNFIKTINVYILNEYSGETLLKCKKHMKFFYIRKSNKRYYCFLEEYDINIYL